MIWKFCLFFAPVIALVSCAPGKTIRLETSKIPLNSAFLYQQKSVKETTMTMPNEAEPQTSKEVTTQDFSYSLQRVLPDGSTEWETRILRYQQEKHTADTIILFDSDNPAPNEDAIKKNIFAAMDTAVMYFTLSPKGKVVRFTGIENIWNSVESTLPEASRPIFRSTMQQFNDESVAGITRNVWAFYPPKKVKKGKIWKESSLISVFNAEKKLKYTYEGAYDKKYHISYASTMMNDPASPGELKIGPAKILYYLSGTGTGTIELDQELGMPFYTFSDENYSGNMEIKVPYLAVTKVPISVRSKTTLQRMNH